MSDPVDLSNLREMTDGDAEMEKMLFEEFYSSSEACLAIMESNCVDGENEQWRSNAHALKGTALNLGAQKLGELCKNAQEGAGISAAEKQAMFDEIKKEYHLVKDFLATA